MNFLQLTKMMQNVFPDTGSCQPMARMTVSWRLEVGHHLATSSEMAIIQFIAKTRNVPFIYIRQHDIALVSSNGKWIQWFFQYHLGW